MITTQNTKVTDVVSKISESYGCKAVEGMLSYQMEKDTIDGKKTIIQNPDWEAASGARKCKKSVHAKWSLEK